MPNPFKAFMDIRREELPLSLLMFSYFFLVITSFWILKPIKVDLFLGHYENTGVDLFSWHLKAPQAELLAKVLNMFVAMIAVTVFSWLVRRFRREQLSYIFSAFFLSCYVVYSQIVVKPGDLTVWTFYLFGDLFSTLMVATFFAFLNDSVTPERARRLYGLVGLGGVTGGAFGSMIVRVWIERLSTDVWLWITFAIAILIILVAGFAGRIVKNDPPPADAKPQNDEPNKDRSNPAIEGARLVFRSRYLLAIVCIVGFYEVVSLIMDFQFKSTLTHYLSGDERSVHLSTVYLITNCVAMFVQMFLTGFAMSRYRLTVALLVLPTTIVLGSAGFLVFPILWVGSLLNTADNGFSYSINQSAKEALYVPTSRDEKYKAKAFIDMFVQRFAKVLAIGVSLLITSIYQDFSSIRYLSIFTLLIMVAWIIAVRYAGRKFDEMTGNEQ